jgi:hypothetical protein
MGAEALTTAGTAAAATDAAGGAEAHEAKIPAASAAPASSNLRVFIKTLLLRDIPGDGMVSPFLATGHRRKC